MALTLCGRTLLLCVFLCFVAAQDLKEKHEDASITPITNLADTALEPTPAASDANVTYQLLSSDPNEPKKKKKKKGFCGKHMCTRLFAGFSLALMAICGLLVTLTRKTAISHWLLHRSLIKPPTKRISNTKIHWNPITQTLELLSDLVFGELGIILIFVATLVAFTIAVKNPLAKETGKVATLCMVILFVPVSRVPWLWKFLFGTSFERIVKFHRWLGIVFFVAVVVHFIYSIPEAPIFETTGKIVPFWGTMSGICFTLLTLLSVGPIRRAVFEVFYYSHIVLMVGGTVCAILHTTHVTRAIRYPLVFYGLSILWRVVRCLQFYRMEATLQVHGSKYNNASKTVSMVLTSTSKTRALANKLEPCAYFWVHVSGVSTLQWHPFSAVVTPQKDSVGFVVKSMGNNTFSDDLVEFAKDHSSTKITLCGPFGHSKVDLNDYESVVLVAGGVGIVPLLNILNQYVYGSSEDGLQKKKLQKLQDFHVVWSVRHAEDLLMIDEFVAHGVDRGSTASSMGLLTHHQVEGSPRVQWNRHVSSVQPTAINGQEELMLKRPTGEEIKYSAGKPILDEMINTSRFPNKKSVAVLACGPPTMIAEAQELAHVCKFDFHKEVFYW